MYWLPIFRKRIEKLFSRTIFNGASPLTILIFNYHKFINTTLFISFTNSGFYKIVLKQGARREVVRACVALCLVYCNISSDDRMVVEAMMTCRWCLERERERSEPHFILPDMR
jgi:hypothetical protein